MILSLFSGKMGMRPFAALVYEGASTTGSTSATGYSGRDVKQYFDAVFLDELYGDAVMSEDAVEKELPPGNGVAIQFTQARHAGPQTTAATEGTPPTSQTFTTFIEVDATIKEFDQYEQVSSTFVVSSLDRCEKIIENFRHDMIETHEWDVKKTVCDDATAEYYANNRSALGDLVYTDVLSTADIRRMQTNLLAANARKFKDGLFHCVITPYDLQALWDENNGDSPLIKTYQGEGGDAVRRYDVYVYGGFKIKVSTLKNYYVDSAGTQGTETAGAVGVGVYNLSVLPFYGKNSFTKVKLGTKGNSKFGIKYNEIIIVDKADSANPTMAFSSIGWRTAFVSKILDSRVAMTLTCASKQYATS